MREVWHEGKRVVSIVEITSRTKVSRAGGGKVIKMCVRKDTDSVSHTGRQSPLRAGLWEVA